MCEWLSYGDWCDVKLLCGGRVFSAHRAVLASVSTFLRHLLLSCPIDESPTFIVLPEFDLDAMSSVLYYIYNGEVIVHKQKLEMFLEIITAMQIFIDSQYLPHGMNYNNLDLECHLETDCCKSNIFTLRLENSQDQSYVNLKKRNKVSDVDAKHLVSDSVCDKDLELDQNPSLNLKYTLANLKSPYEDRQKKSFLSDSFVETYPQNGNVNGLRAGVLAISNEYYRAPASVLLTNANGNHLSVDNILLDSCKKTSELISDSPTVLHLQRRCTMTQSEPDYADCSKRLCDLSYNNDFRTEKIKNKYICETKVQNDSKNNWMSHIPISSNEFVRLGFREQFLSGLYVPSVDYISPSLFETLKSMQDCRTLPARSALPNRENRQSWNETERNSISKTTILNHVLDSPWCPRMPNNFKPFRRKAENKFLPQETVKEYNISDSNNNDNIQHLSMDTCNTSEVIISTETKTTATSLLGHSDILHFKCTHCNQVFLSRDLLSVHIRRHSTNARYTCGECDKTFSQLRNFKYHMSIHRGTREFAATCTVCGKYFNDRGYLSSHMKIHRNRKEYKCTLCPKSFNQRVAYNMHVRIHTGIKPHVCEQCGKAFSRKMLLKQHQRTHSGERPYACPHCEKRFADRSNMTLHLRLHTGVKPFSCTLCPKSFTKKHHLKSHLNFHTGSKPYSCPRCKLAFTQSSNMRTHLKKCRAPEPPSNTETSQTTP